VLLKQPLCLRFLTPPSLINVVLSVILLGLCVVFCFFVLWLRYFLGGFVVHAFVW
jgi:hypothetical protein